MTDKKFPLISGNLSIDLVNTELVRRGKRHDLLQSERDLLDWLQEITAEHSFGVETQFLKSKESISQVLPPLLKMRAKLRDQFEAIADQQTIPDEFITFLENIIKKAPFTYKLINQKLIPIPVGEIEDVLLSLISFDALTLIENKKLLFLKRCANTDCVLLFIDESGRRKWCSMNICGNRKKVSRFQNRKLDHD